MSRETPSAPPRGHYGQQPSKSADAARREEFEALRAMTAYQRVLLALELGTRGFGEARREDPAGRGT